MTRITDMRGVLQPESSWWLVNSPLAGAGHIVAAALPAEQLVKHCNKFYLVTIVIVIETAT